MLIQKTSVHVRISKVSKQLRSVRKYNLFLRIYYIISKYIAEIVYDIYFISKNLTKNMIHFACKSLIYDLVFYDNKKFLFGVI